MPIKFKRSTKTLGSTARSWISNVARQKEITSGFSGFHSLKTWTSLSKLQSTTECNSFAAALCLSPENKTFLKRCIDLGAKTVKLWNILPENWCDADLMFLGAEVKGGANAPKKSGVLWSVTIEQRRNHEKHLHTVTSTDQTDKY